MPEEIKTVAVIGAGISGVCTAAHLLRQGIIATVYERMSVAGGVWHFDERTAHEQKYPNEIPSHGDYQRIVFEDEDVYETPPRTPPEPGSGHLHASWDDSKSTSHLDDARYAEIAHSSPGPCYAGLKNNVSLTAMKTSLADWPAGLEEYVGQQYLEEYIQEISRVHRVQEVTRYNTRVEDVRKVDEKWRVCTTTLVLPDQRGTEVENDGDKGRTIPLSPFSRLKRSITYFDAVVVASGHYHMPRIPDIPGLQRWKELFPDRVSHSKGYRNATKYRGSNVLIVGAGVSSVDIAKEIALLGGTVYQSSRDGIFDLPQTMLPEGSYRVSGVEAFVTDEVDGNQTESMAAIDHNSTIPGHIKLTDSTTLSNIHFVIIATGYITSYPFLAPQHADTLLSHDAQPTTIVTLEGDMTHNLHKDIFYIEDPTLSFVGVPYHIATFSLFDFQAQAVARVYASGLSGRLPSRQDMRDEYLERVRRKGLGRTFHSLREEGAEIDYVQELVGLVNERLSNGEEAMSGHNEVWLVAYRKQKEMIRKRFAGEL